MSSPRKSNRHRVALLIETSSDYSRGLLRGVMAYLREHRPWTIFHGEYRRGEIVPAELQQAQCDGIIARIENHSIAQVVCECGLPTVDVSAARLLPNIPCVETDDAAIAQMAADHLLERGFKHFAFIGDDRFNWSKLRREHFQHVIATAGYQCHTILPRKSEAVAGHWNFDAKQIKEWIQQLPKPIGVMGGWDGYGQQTLEACQQMGVIVPDEVAVLGVDNDDVECELSNPPLSSIATNPRRIGYEAAALLDRMMSGKRVESKLYVVPPRHVIVRQSTDVLAIEDRRISAAVRFIREHACEGIGVNEVLAAVPLSRRVLESRFRKLLGRSPHQEILRVQLQHIKLLLVETDLTQAAIAEKTGFEHEEYMSVVFKRVIGDTPGGFRKRLRGK